MKLTVSHSEKANNIPGGGWTNFRSHLADWMLKLNNRFYTVKNGQLWLHNENLNGLRCNFYGVQYGSSITPVLNDLTSDDKIFKTIVLESNDSWKAELLTNYTNGTIEKAEFNQKESRWFAFTRQDEDANDLNGNAVQGIGASTGSNGLVINFTSIPNYVSIGNQLLQLNGSAQEIVGTIAAVSANSITISAIITAPITGLFFFAKKDSRIEGSEIRGHYLQVKLIHDGGAPSEIYACNTNAVKSYV